MGGHDAVIDVVGTVAALEVLGVDEVAASAVATGTGMVRAAHGLLPNPPPAVVRLLEGVPTYGRDTTVELTTPTGAALLAALAGSFGPLPAMRVAATGFGAGGGELDDLPNCTQVVIGTAAHRPAARAGPAGAVLEANLDDATGEQLAHAVAALLDAGAHDAWVTPVVMKKGRPGHTVHALCDPALAADLRAVLRSTTGTLGTRASTARRWPAARTMHRGRGGRPGHSHEGQPGPGQARVRRRGPGGRPDRPAHPRGVVAGRGGVAPGHRGLLDAGRRRRTGVSRTTVRALAVFCGSSDGRVPTYRQAAVDLADQLVARDITLVYGGAHVGLMGVLADRTLAGGGRVTGVIPGHMADREVAHGGLTELVVVRHHARAQGPDGRAGRRLHGPPRGAGNARRAGRDRDLVAPRPARPSPSDF